MIGSMLESSDVCTHHPSSTCCCFDAVTVSKDITRLSVILLLKNSRTE